MYRVSPFNYLVDGMLSTGVANTRVTCASYEYSTIQAPAGQTCGQYLQNYINVAGGYVLDPNATQNCQFCAASSTNVYLAQVSSSYSHRWRNLGIMWAFIIINTLAALFLYWWVRVPKKQKVQDIPVVDPASRVQSHSSKPT